MPLLTFDALFENADQQKEPVAVVAAGGADVTVLEALAMAQKRGWVTPLLTGNQSEIEAAAQKTNVDLTPFEIIESDQPAQKAVELIKTARAQMMMKGQIDTPSLMKAILNRETGLRTGKTVCQMVLMEIPKDGKRFLLADTGITIAPNEEQLHEIIQHAIEAAQALGSEIPNIALLSATEKVNPAFPETEISARIQKEAGEGKFGNCKIQGPLSFDLAYANDAGSKKQLEGAVIGNADAMIFPSLLAANLVVKAIMYTADCKFGGVLLGVSAPVIFMSRADSTTTRLNSIAYGLHLYKHKPASTK